MVSEKEELEKPATKEEDPKRRRATKINQKGRGGRKQKEMAEMKE